MPNLRSTLALAATRATGGRERGPSVSNTCVPATTSEDYNPELATVAASILYRSPLPSKDGRPIYILNSAAFPDAYQVDYNTLLSYVLARLPSEDELLSGTEYEMIFLAGGQNDSATSEKKQGPDRGWYVQAYNVLGRATRKKLKKLYVVFPRSWVRVLVVLLSQIVSRKFSRKLENVSTLSTLALHIPIEDLLLPPSAYLQDRKVSPEIYAPFVTGRRAFGAKHPLPKNLETGQTRLPRVLRETTSFLCLPSNLDTEGLFRIPPHSVLSGVLKEAYDRGQKFIIWKERDAIFVQPGIMSSLVDEVQLEDTYGVHLAASLIKTWYRELREPIIPVSAYANFQEQFQDQSVPVSLDRLVDLISPASNASPLSATSREIMTRHLLPLLFTVASHEPENKMTPENLAVCFSMCLVCGPDQMQDAKMSPVLRHVLRAAIELWPQLRVSIPVDQDAFAKDLEAPGDYNDYEDPLEMEGPKGAAYDDTIAEGNRIDMNDAEATSDATEVEQAPALPPRRRSRAASLKGAVKSAIPSLDSLPGLRKPTTAAAEPQTHVAPEPPRYSTIFDHDGNSIDVEGSPTTYGPVDGLGPPRRADFSFSSDVKKPDPVSEPAGPQPTIIMPKRKAIATNPRTENTEVTDPTQQPRKPSETNALLARMATQQAATNLAQRIGADNPPTTSTIASSTKTNGTTTSAPPTASTDLVFRKPSWPASATRQPPNLHTLAKPIVPVRKAHTLPAPVNTAGAHNVPKPRTPSPGLLLRINSMDPAVQGARAAAEHQPKRLNLESTSVDDLRRLYEERVATARSLREAAEGERRGSNLT